MSRVDYQKLAELNAAANRRSLRSDGRTLCPITGEALVSQKEAARRLGVTARGLRDMGQPAYQREGRGGRTLYHSGTIEALHSYRRAKKRARAIGQEPPMPSPFQVYLSTAGDDGRRDALESIMDAWTGIAEKVVALSSGDISERYIDPVGAKKSSYWPVRCPVSHTSIAGYLVSMASTLKLRAATQTQTHQQTNGTLRRLGVNLTALITFWKKTAQILKRTEAKTMASTAKITALRHLRSYV